MSNKKAVEVNDLSIVKNYVDQKLKAKSNTYVVTGREIEVGMDLSGKMLVFDTSKTNDNEECWGAGTEFIRSSNGYVLQSGGPPSVVLVNANYSYDVLIYDYSAIQHWKESTLTLPDDFGTVTVIASNTGGSEYTSINDFVTYIDGGEAGVFDCESNHNRIVAVDEKVDKLADNTAKLVSSVDVRVKTLEEGIDAINGGKLYNEFVYFVFNEGTNYARITFSFLTDLNTKHDGLYAICQKLGQNVPVVCSGDITIGEALDQWEPLYLKLDTTTVNGVVLVCTRGHVERQITLTSANITINAHEITQIYSVSES